MPTRVPNEHPVITLPKKVAVIGERPGTSEAQMKRPFVGPSGDLLVSIMNAAGLQRSACLMGNVVQYDMDARSGYFYDESIQNLKEDIQKYDPNIVLLLGDRALKVAGVNHTVNAYRGSLFICEDSDSPFFGRKCISSHSPNNVIRQWDFMPLLRFDVIRTAQDAESKELILPSRVYDIELNAQDIIDRLADIRPGDAIAVDIEGGIGNISCISFATSPTYAFLYAPSKFGVEENMRILKMVGKVLQDENIGKILQNATYDCYCLYYEWKISVANVVDDTMLSGWEIYPELPKGLGTQVSIYTREPAYKFERKTDSIQVFHTYNCKDSCLTYEIRNRHHEILTGPAARHYEFHMSLLSATRYIMQRGIKYDYEKQKHLLDEMQVRQAELQTTINTRARQPVNCNSPKQLAELLYKKMKFEPQYVKEAGRKTTTVTTDAGALLTLYKKHDSQLIYEILKWKQYDGKRKQLVPVDPDGRARGSYNIVGTKTGRYSVSKSITSSGAALQTITKSNRACYVADDGYWFFQCDLEGADGWTIAGHCAARGDFNMLHDYQHGIKPAQVIAMMQLHGAHIANMGQVELKELIKRTKDSMPKNEWEFLYFTCKRVQHGTNYGLGKITMVDVILKDSWKYLDEPVLVAARDCDKLKMLYLLRYPGVEQWQRWVKNEIYTNKALTCPSGHTRRFFGRPSDNATIQGAYSQEPQNTTTYATNLALFNLWNDADNRDSSNNLIIEPLHQVHDALCGQFPKERSVWAAGKLREYFNNPVNIAGTELVIPFEGRYGPNWDDQSVGTI